MNLKEKIFGKDLSESDRVVVERLSLEELTIEEHPSIQDKFLLLAGIHAQINRLLSKIYIELNKKKKKVKQHNAYYQQYILAYTALQVNIKNMENALKSLTAPTSEDNINYLMHKKVLFGRSLVDAKSGVSGLQTLLNSIINSK